MTSIYYLAALGAAFCWASASMLARHPVKEIGEFAFIRIRMVVSFLLLALICFFSGKFSNINFQQIDLIVLLDVFYLRDIREFTKKTNKS